MPIQTFLRDVEANLKSGVATEHTYRPALKALFEGVLSGATAVNEPKHAPYGAPDFVLMRDEVPFAHVEAKDVGVVLEGIINDSERSTPKTSNGKQLKRYRAALSSFLFTDGLTWYWFRDGALHSSDPVILATWNAVSKRLHLSSRGGADLQNLLQQVAMTTGVVIGKPRELARRLADIAHWLREVITQIFAEQSEQGSLHQQLEAFKKTLLPDLQPRDFADMYAQTIVYGLFAARLSSPSTSHFTRMSAAVAIPKTNPFLRSLFQQIAGFDLDDRIDWLVDNCALLLAHTDMAEVLRDFGRATHQHDPVVHFYETFLAAYDPKMRESRGVYYTPEPVVNFIVRSVHEVLQNYFDKDMGLADEQTVILDPATGTATFLNMVIQQIHEELAHQGLAGTWDQYVPEKLLNRVFGFELLMAPYTIAHLKLSILLGELGYTFRSNQRLGVYLTNTLAESSGLQHVLAFAQTIASEGEAANDVKHNKRVMVVLGNPPYSGHSVNTSSWIGGLLRGKLPSGAKTANYYEVDGGSLGERNPKWLQNDYVKFIRFGQWRITETGEGILAFITDNSYLDNPTFRGMRQSLMTSFNTIYVLNLHGNNTRKERSPDGRPDENVFDIQQGVAISLFIKQCNNSEQTTVYYADLWGDRTEKYAWLNETEISTISWEILDPQRPWYRFLPQRTPLTAEYQRLHSLSEIFPINNAGLVTGRDDFVISMTRYEAQEKLDHFVNSQTSDTFMSQHYGLNSSKSWSLTQARLHMQRDDQRDNKIVPFSFHPFDKRVIIYAESIMERPRKETMEHMLYPNIGLVMTRTSAITLDYTHFFVVDTTINARYFPDRAGIPYLCPLYIYPSNGQKHLTTKSRHANFDHSFIDEITGKLDLQWVDDGKGDLTETIGPEDVFHYMYALVYSPTYRSRYDELLKIDFPRIPIISNRDLFGSLAQFGAQLIDLHLLRIDAGNSVAGNGGAAILRSVGKQGVSFPISGSSLVEKVVYIPPQSDQLGEVRINTTQKFVGVDAETWAMKVGGYQPLDKWLKDRKGRILSSDDITHYLRMVIALRETRRIMDAIAEVLITVDE